MVSSFLTLGFSTGGVWSGCLGVSVIWPVYTGMLGCAELFKGFQRRLFRELPLTGLAGHEIIGVSYGHRGSEIQDYPSMVTGGAGNLFQSVGHVRLCAQIKLHVGMDRKSVVAFLADAPPFTVRPHESFIDPEAGLFTNGAGYRAEAPFHFLLSDSDHVDASIAGGEMESQQRRGMS